MIDRRMGIPHLGQKAIAGSAIGVDGASSSHGFFEQGSQMFSPHVRGHLQHHLAIPADHADESGRILDRRTMTPASFLPPTPWSVPQGTRFPLRGAPLMARRLINLIYLHDILQLTPFLYLHLPFSYQPHDASGRVIITGQLTGNLRRRVIQLHQVDGQKPGPQRQLRSLKHGPRSIIEVTPTPSTPVTIAPRGMRAMPQPRNVFTATIRTPYVAIEPDAISRNTSPHPSARRNCLAFCSDTADACSHPLHPRWCSFPLFFTHDAPVSVTSNMSELSLTNH